MRLYQRRKDVVTWQWQLFQGQCCRYKLQDYTAQQLYPHVMTHNYTFSCDVTWLTTTHSHVMSHDSQLHTHDIHDSQLHLVMSYDSQLHTRDVTRLTTTHSWCHLTHNYTLVISHDSQLQILMWCHMTQLHTHISHDSQLQVRTVCWVKPMQQVYVLMSITHTDTHSVSVSLSCNMIPIKFCGVTNHWTEVDWTGLDSQNVRNKLITTESKI